MIYITRHGIVYHRRVVRVRPRRSVLACTFRRHRREEYLQVQHTCRPASALGSALALAVAALPLVVDDPTRLLSVVYY